MREIAGSAAAPAARCRKFRRGSFILNLPQSFDHLVCEQLDRVGHFEAEHSGRYQIDDEFELGGLHDRQIGGPRALENSARVDTYLTPRIQIIPRGCTGVDAATMRSSTSCSGFTNRRNRK